MFSQIELTILWSDIHLFELRVTAGSGRFGGTADVYVGIGGLAKAASMIQGFPRSASDVRELTFGEFGPKCAGGAVSLKFYSRGGAVRCFAECRIESDYGNENTAEYVQFCAPIEPSAIDSFGADLRRLEAEKSGTAKLSTTMPVASA